MAKVNKITYKNSKQQVSPQQAALEAPAASTPPQVVTTGNDQDTSVLNGPVGKAVQASIINNALGGTNLQNYVPSSSDVTDPSNYKYTGQFGNTWSPTVYNQSAIDQYNQGLQAAKAWDENSSLSPGFKQRIYQTINGPAPQAQLQQYVPNAAQQYSTSNLNDGSTMMNPSDPVQAQQWNLQKLQADHPDWDQNTINNFMGQKYNWQAYNALVNAGYIVPTQASRDYTAYQQAQAQAQQQAQAQPIYQSYEPQAIDTGLTNYVEDNSGYQEQPEPAPEPMVASADDGYAISAPSGVYETPDTSYYSSVGDAVRDKNNYWKSLFGL